MPAGPGRDPAPTDRPTPAGTDGETAGSGAGSEPVVLDATRVTVAVPGLRLDLAVPGTALVAELVPAVVELTGTGRAGGSAPADGGAAGPGWLLHRVGAGLLDPGRTLADQGVLDGEVLHLVPADRVPPAPVFDDVVDVLAPGAAAGPGAAAWSPGASRAVWSVLAASAVVLAAVRLGRGGPPWAGVGTLAGLAAAALLGVAAGLARGRGAVGPARVAGLAAAAPALVAGVALVGGPAVLGGPGPGAPGLLGGLVLAGAVAVLATLATGRPGGAETAVATGAGVLAAATLVELLTGGPPDRVAAGVAAAAVLLAALAPGLAAALGRLPMPWVPAEVGQLRPEDELLDVATVRGRARSSRAVLSGLLGASAGLAAVGAAGLSGALPLAGATGYALPDRLLVAATALALALRARLYPSVGARATVLTGAGLAALAGVAPAALTGGPGGAAAVTALLLIAFVATAGAALLPGRRIAPTWSRTADVLEVVVTLAVVPLAVWSAGLVGIVRNLPG